MNMAKGYERLTGEFEDRKIPSSLDGEFEPDYTHVNSCEKCGSLNISFDNTGQHECRECNHKSGSATKIDFQKLSEDMTKQERERIENGLRRGEQFGIAE